MIKTVRRTAGQWFVSAVLLCAAGARAAGPTFVDVTATVTPGLPQVGFSSVAWADYDNDGRLDFLLTGIYYTSFHNPDGSGTTTGNYTSQLWRNMGNGFSNVTATVAPGLPGISDGLAAWGDYDNDGRLDLLLPGQLWRNTESGFTNVTATIALGLPALWGASMAWGDYDNDGRLDFIITGGFVSQVWRNTESGFVNVTAVVAPGLPGVTDGSVAWGDYDNDGRLDFIITGGIPRRSDLDDNYPYYSPISQIWRNTGSGFENVTTTVAPGLPGVYYSSVAWGDYDNDGRLDFLLTGSSISQLWRNTENGFVNVTASVAPGLPGIYWGSAAWGDYDNDGRLDILLSGGVCQIWRNTVNGFTNMTSSVAPDLQRVFHSSVQWGDYDSDGRLDFLLTGATSFDCDGCDLPDTVSQLWRNNTAQSNPPPAVITKGPASVSPSSVRLNASIHPHRQAAAGWFIWGDTTNYGRVTAVQPVGNGNSFTNFSQCITGLNMGVTYYCRAIVSNDQGQVVLGIEQHFLLAAPGVTTSLASGSRPNSATLNAHVSPNNLSTYGWFEWGLTPVYGQLTPVQLLANGFDANLSQHLPGLEVGTTYYFRAVVSNSLGVVYGTMQCLVTPTFANVTATVAPGLQQIGQGSVAWGDYDNDGLLDFVLTGYLYDEEANTDLFLGQLWRNTGNGFVDVTAAFAPGLPGAIGGTAAWGDYDNDGRLDLFLTGYSDVDGRSEISQVWRNTGNGLANVTGAVAPGLPQVGHSSMAWGDYDNDGRLDFILTGSSYYEGDETSYNVYISQLWRNTGSGFTNVTAMVAPGLPGVGSGSVAWGDYDNDGRLDFLLSGYFNDGTNHYISQLWRNTGNGFTNVTEIVAPGLPGVAGGRVAWGDYDNDGRLDFLLTGSFDNGTNNYICQLWHNTGNGFTKLPATIAPRFPGLAGTVAWADYDNDGRLDLFLSGHADNNGDESLVSQIWRNTGSGFTNVTASVAPGLLGVLAGSVGWGDYDNDGRLDLLLTGYDYNKSIVQLWRNYTPVTNAQASVVIFPGNRTHGFGAESGIISVTSTSPGIWRAWSTSDWMYVWATTANPTNGQVGYQLSANTTGQDRIAQIHVADKVFTILQRHGVCITTVTPPIAVHGWRSETGIVMMTTTVPGCPFAPGTTNSWINFVYNQWLGTNAGIDYVVAENPTRLPRSGSLTSGDGVFEIVQAGNLNIPHPDLLGSSLITTINHAFGAPHLEGGLFVPGLSSDFLLHQGFPGAILPPVYVSWDAHTQFIWKVVAPAGMKMVIQPPPGAQARIQANWRWDWFGGGSSLPGIATVEFDGLQGEPPAILGATSLSSTHGFFGLSLDSAPFTNTFSFTSMTLVGAVPHLTTGVGGRWYSPRTDCALQVSYEPAQSSDPGRFVKLMPRDPTLNLRIVNYSPTNGPVIQIRGPRLETHIVQASSNLVHWAPISTNQMPDMECPTCPYVQILDRTATNALRRFYRAVEK